MKWHLELEPLVIYIDRYDGQSQIVDLVFIFKSGGVASVTLDITDPYAVALNVQQCNRQSGNPFKDITVVEFHKTGEELKVVLSGLDFFHINFLADTDSCETVWSGDVVTGVVFQATDTVSATYKAGL